MKKAKKQKKPSRSPKSRKPSAKTLPGPLRALTIIEKGIKTSRDMIDLFVASIHDVASRSCTHQEGGTIIAGGRAILKTVEMELAHGSRMAGLEIVSREPKQIPKARAAQ